MILESPCSAYQQDMRMYADPTRTWAHPTQKGFVLHDTQEPRYLNGGDHSLCNNQMSHPGPTYPASSSLFNQTQASSASPQHRNAVSVVRARERSRSLFSLRHSRPHVRPYVVVVVGCSWREFDEHLHSQKQSIFTTPPARPAVTFPLCFYLYLYK